MTTTTATSGSPTPADRARWLDKAQSLTPTLRRTPHTPQPFDRTRPLGRRDTLQLDFNRHLVGHFRFRLEPDGVVDAPTRLRLIFAERPDDLALPPEPHTAQLSRAWVQDEVVTLDDLPAEMVLPRRYAFRYVRIEVIDTSRAFKVRLADASADGLTSADDAAVPPLPPDTPDDLRGLDAVGLATLRSCMQTVFEDGPKRDRRLWTGDLRLQAQANALSFRNFDLVRRCLYLLAAFAKPDGWWTADVYERPAPRPGGCLILDYAVLAGPMLLDHFEAAGDETTARDLFPLARDQFRLASAFLKDGLLEVPTGWWLFSDWQDGLDPQAPTHATILYAARQLTILAQRLGEDPGPAADLIRPMTEAARRHLWDPHRGVFVSGNSRQVSWAAAAWMVLARVVEGPEARDVLTRTMALPNAVKPAGPYLYHHVVEAMLACDMDAEAARLLRRYWGSMIAAGADTFDEVWDPDRPDFSPYGHPSLNSRCHAWSCTPVYFVRKYGPRLYSPSHAHPTAQSQTPPRPRHAV